MKRRHFRICNGIGNLAVALALAGVPAANAAIVYDNGPINGTSGGANAISGGWEQTDSFSVSAASALTQVQLGLWAELGNTPSSVGWSIGTTPYGSEISSGVSSLTNVLAMTLITSPRSYSIYESEFAISGTVIPGSYWLTLHSGLPSGVDLGVDVNFGPATSFQRNTSLGIASREIDGHSFRIVGEAATAPVPEPASFIFWGLGGIGCAAARWQRRRTAAIKL